MRPRCGPGRAGPCGSFVNRKAEGRVGVRIAFGVPDPRMTTPQKEQIRGKPREIPAEFFELFFGLWWLASGHTPPTLQAVRGKDCPPRAHAAREPGRCRVIGQRFATQPAVLALALVGVVFVVD